MVVTEDRTGFSPLNVYARSDEAPCQKENVSQLASALPRHTSANATQSLMRVFVMTRADTDLQIPYQ